MTHLYKSGRSCRIQFLLQRPPCFCRFESSTLDRLLFWFSDRPLWNATVWMVQSMLHGPLTSTSDRPIWTSFSRPNMIQLIYIHFKKCNCSVAPPNKYLRWFGICFLLGRCLFRTLFNCDVANTSDNATKTQRRIAKRKSRQSWRWGILSWKHMSHQLWLIIYHYSWLVLNHMTHHEFLTLCNDVIMTLFILMMTSSSWVIIKSYFLNPLRPQIIVYLNCRILIGRSDILSMPTQYHVTYITSNWNN